MLKVYTWRYFGSLAFAVSWFLHFLLLSLFACFCERNWHMFSTSVLISPFLGSENSISGHLLKPILPLYLLDLYFTTFSMTVTVLPQHTFHMVTRCMLPSIYTLSTIFIFFWGGAASSPNPPNSVFFMWIQFLHTCKYIVPYFLICI